MAMLNWNEYRNQILARIGEIGKLSPDTIKGYMTLGGAGAKTGHLDAKTRELIALAVAISLRCDGCITVHTAAAVRHCPGLAKGAARDPDAVLADPDQVLDPGVAALAFGRVGRHCAKHGNPPLALHFRPNDPFQLCGVSLASRSAVRCRRRHHRPSFSRLVCANSRRSPTA